MKLIYLPILLILIIPLATAQTAITQNGIEIVSSKETYYCEPIFRNGACLVKTVATIKNNNPFVAVGNYGAEFSKPIQINEIGDSVSTFVLEQDTRGRIETPDNFLLNPDQERKVYLSFFASQSGKFNITFHFGAFSAVLDPFFNVTINASSPSLHLINGSVEIDQDFQFENSTEISTELSDELDNTSFLVRKNKLENRTINFTDGFGENTQFLTGIGDTLEINISIPDLNAVLNFEICFRASTGSGADDPNLTINQAFTDIILDFPTGNNPNTDTCFNIDKSYLLQGSQLIGMGCTNCGNPVNNRNYLASDPTPPNEGTSFSWDGITLTKITTEDHMIWATVEENLTGLAIRTNFNHTLDSDNNYWLRTRVTSSETITGTVHHYLNDTQINLSTVNQTLLTGENAINLNTIITNQTNATFRIYTNPSATISEISLIEGINDSENPVIQNCQVNNTLLTCGDSIRMSCNVTDDNFLNNVYFFWDDLTSNVEMVNRIINTDIFFKDVTYVHNTSGSLDIYNFTQANATDQAGNFVIEPLALQFNYSCGEAFDITPPEIFLESDPVISNVTQLDKNIENVTLLGACFDENAHNFSISAYNSSDVIFNISNSTVLTNINLTLNRIINLTPLGVGQYDLDAICFDNRSNLAFTKVMITLNDFSPIILVSPENNSNLSFLETVSSSTAFTFDLTQQSTCSLLFNGTVQSTELLPIGQVSLDGSFDQNQTILWNVSCVTQTSSIEIPSPFHILTVEIIPVIPPAEIFSRVTCPADSIEKVLIFGLFFIICFTIIIIGFTFKNGLIGSVGSLMMLFLSTFTYACIFVFGLILTAFSLMLMSWFVYKGSTGFR